MKQEKAIRRTVVLGITGSIAAYKSAELARLLVARGIEVRAAMTESAKRLVGAPTLRALTGHPVMDDEWANPVSADGMDHIAGTRDAKLILVAPASANFIAKAAHGFADNLLLGMLLARDCPAMVAPAMNRAMWGNPATQSNVARLAEAGVEIVGPEEGEQACGEHGFGRLADVADIADRVESFMGGRDLEGIRMIVSAGATCEYLDPMRMISNASSGKMGVAIADAARLRGAHVTLIAGKMSCAPPRGVLTISAETGAEMEATLAKLAPKTDIFVSVAAVADYRPSAASRAKLPSGKGFTLKLERTNDILARIAGLPRAPYCVGFAAETHNMMANAKRKMKQKKIPMIVANNLSSTIGDDYCKLTVIDKAGEAIELGRKKKSDAARELVRLISVAYQSARGIRGKPKIARSK